MAKVKHSTKKNVSLVYIDGETALTNSLIVAKGCEIEHASAIKMVRKYKTEFEELGISRFEIAKNRGTQGVSTEYAILNEDQATFLITLFRNTPIVVRFKVTLVKEFRKALNEINRLYKQRMEPAWQKARIEVKKARREATDAQQKFIAHAKAQGSKNAERYWTNFVRMENAAFGFPQENGVRDSLTSRQLTNLATAEYVEANVIDDGVKSELDYHDIFQLAKHRVKDLVHILSHPVTITS